MGNNWHKSTSNLSLVSKCI